MQRSAKGGQVQLAVARFYACETNRSEEHFPRGLFDLSEANAFSGEHAAELESSPLPGHDPFALTARTATSSSYSSSRITAGIGRNDGW